MKLIDKIAEVLKVPICDNCLGRITAGQLLSGIDNKKRGKIIRHFVAFLIDSGEKLNVDFSNFYGIKFHNVKLKVEKREKCYICNNFFDEDLKKIAKKVIEKIRKYEFKTFLIGCKPTNEMLKKEEEFFEKIGIEFVETIREEIDREVGKIISKKLRKKVDYKNPEIVVILDLENETIRLQIKSLFVYGKYKKLVRGIPQSKWICNICKGKGCIRCEGKGKLYPTSIQEIIEKPLLKATKAKEAKFHAEGREEIDARCLAYRQFVIELVKPVKRKIDLKKIREQINKSKKIFVSQLKIVGKNKVKEIKTKRAEKTYLVRVIFAKEIDKEKLKELKELERIVIKQKTPLRVLHRRSDKIRRRKVLKISWKLIGKKELELKIRAQAGLYIKELVTGDYGRTKPSICEILNNEAKKILLDVIKIH